MYTIFMLFLQGGIFQLALSPSGTMLAGIDGDGRLTLWDMPSGRMRKSWKIDNQHKLTESFVNSPQTRTRKRLMCNYVP